jgi:hypothetical protein
LLLWQRERCWSSNGSGSSSHNGSGKQQQQADKPAHRTGNVVAIAILDVGYQPDGGWLAESALGAGHVRVAVDC